MTTSGTAKVTIPQLNGGVNVYDIPSRVADNQLTACNNLWWHRGTLRTRPGLAVDDMQWREVDAYTIRQRVGEQDLLLARFDQAEEAVRFYASHLSLAGGHQRLGFWGEGYTLKDACDNPTALGIRAKKNADTNWYYLLSNGEILKEAYGAEATEGWTAAEPYVPTVLINGVGEQCEAGAEPSVYEDYNMLTRAFWCHLTPDGKSTTWKLPMGNLATDLPGAERDSEVGGVAAHIEIDVYGENGLRTIAVDMTVGEGGGVPVPVLPLTAAEAGVTGYTNIEMEIRFRREAGEVEIGLFGRENGQNANRGPIGALPFVVSNSLRVKAWRSREYEKDRLTICKMTRGEWFGGDVSGIAGGTRFFVCGNPDEPDLLCWSGIEHPLYFPEHNRVRVGDDHQAITAMGKQGSLLVLYKEREMYALQYSSGTESDYAFAESGGVAVTSYMAKFLLTPINASVGCDCPDTVRLVNNRLVWACSDGSVYMLTATNPYSERNVRMISRNVRRLLTECGKDVLKDAQAGEYEGYYLLLARNRVFLMNTQTSAFVSFNYYNDEDNAAKAIPWYVWTLPDHLTYTGMVSGENTVKLAVTDPERGEGTVAALKGDTDDGVPIPCHFATKMWDFGIQDRKKSIEQIYMGLGCAELSRVQVTYITDRGRTHEPYRMVTGTVCHEGYIPRRRLTPNVRMVQAFGLCLDSPTGLELDEIQIKVRQQGVVR
jgi:hypothetical protein